MFTTTVAALVFIVAPSPAHPAAPVPRDGTISNCGHDEANPDFIMIACGEHLGASKWMVWSTTVALATGIQEINDCEPSCAAAKFHP
jgi:hypothetical protein